MTRRVINECRYCKVPRKFFDNKNAKFFCSKVCQQNFEIKKKKLSPTVTNPIRKLKVQCSLCPLQAIGICRKKFYCRECYPSQKINYSAKFLRRSGGAS